MGKDLKVYLISFTKEAKGNRAFEITQMTCRSTTTANARRFGIKLALKLGIAHDGITVRVLEAYMLGKIPFFMADTERWSGEEADLSVVDK